MAYVHYSVMNVCTFFTYRMSAIVTNRMKRPLLWPDFIFTRTLAGKEQARCLKILHDVTNSVKVHQVCVGSFAEI